MKLSSKAIDQILTTPPARQRIALVMKVSDQHIYKGLKANKIDGFLTKASALKIIREETGLHDQEILTEEALSDVK